MKKIVFILSVMVVSLMAVADSTSPYLYKVSIAPSHGDWFQIVVSGPEGIKTQVGKHPNSINLSRAVELGRKLEQALNSQVLKWSDVTYELIRRMAGRPIENDYADPSTVVDPSVEVFKIIEAQEVKDFSVSIAPSHGDWFQIVVSGPEGIKTQVGKHPNSINLSRAVELGRKLEQALNSQVLKWSDVTYELIRRMAGRPIENDYADPSTVVDPSVEVFKILEKMEMPGKSCAALLVE